MWWEIDANTSCVFCLASLISSHWHQQIFHFPGYICLRKVTQTQQPASFLPLGRYGLLSYIRIIYYVLTDQGGELFYIPGYISLQKVTQTQQPASFPPPRRYGLLSYTRIIYYVLTDQGGKLSCTWESFLLILNSYFLPLRTLQVPWGVRVKPMPTQVKIYPSTLNLSIRLPRMFRGSTVCFW